MDFRGQGTSYQQACLSQPAHQWPSNGSNASDGAATQPPPDKPKTVAPPGPNIGGLTSTDSNLYQLGGLHLSVGLFLGSLVIPPTSPTATSTICHDDFFHVELQDVASPSKSFDLTGTTHLVTERRPSSHETFGIYMLSTGNGAVTTAPSNEMNTFLSQARYHWSRHSFLGYRSGTEAFGHCDQYHSRRHCQDPLHQFRAQTPWTYSTLFHHP
jgi:hypothetical protein